MKKQIMILLGTALLAGCTGSGGGQAKMTGQEVHSRFMTMIADGQYPEAYDFLTDRLTDEEILQKDYALIKGIMSAPVRVVNRYYGDFPYVYITDYEYSYDENGLPVTVKEHYFEENDHGMDVLTRTESTFYEDGTVMTREVYQSYEGEKEFLSSESEYLADGTLVHSVSYGGDGMKMTEDQLYDDGSRENIMYTDGNKPASRTVYDSAGIPELMETYDIPYGYKYQNFQRVREGRNTVITYETVSTYDGSVSKTREVYDEKGRQISTVTESGYGACSMAYTYDGFDNTVITESDCYGMKETTTRVYKDAENGQLERVVHRTSTGTDYDEYFEYDENGKISRYSVVQADGTMSSEILYQDGLALSEVYVNPDGSRYVTNHEYDALGRQVRTMNDSYTWEYYYLDTTRSGE